MRHVRGQAAVELALGTLVLTTVLMFGIHFGEMGFLSAKVHEAAAAAIWDSTAYRTHQVTLWYDSSGAVGSAQGSSGRYSDFDGNTQAHGTRSGNPPHLALTQAEAIQVNCNKAGAYGLPAPAPYTEPGGISCTAGADMKMIEVATNVLDQGRGFFKSSQINGTHGARYSICSTGRFGGGICGRIEMLLGDDGLHDGSEKNECGLQGSGGQGGPNATNGCGGNPHFYNAAYRVFNSTMRFTGLPENWASGIIPDTPGRRLTGFYTTFRGEESNFMETVPNGDTWEVSPMNAVLTQGRPYQTAFGARKTCSGGVSGHCYLGKVNCD